MLANSFDAEIDRIDPKNEDLYNIEEKYYALQDGIRELTEIMNGQKWNIIKR